MFKQDSEDNQLIDKVVHISRVAKVVKGGRRFSFSAIVVVGDGEGGAAAGGVDGAVARPAEADGEGLVVLVGVVAGEVESAGGGAKIFVWVCVGRG